VVLEKPGKRLEIHMDKKSCYGCRECIKKIIPVIEGATRKKFNKPGYVCNIKKNVCSLKLVESQRFNVTTGVCGMPKEEGQVSGDNYSFMELKEHKYLVALSDGMGTGAQASMESSITINMLEQLLEVGYDHEMAVRTINSIQMLKSPDDSFSTLDMVLIDLYTGEAKIIKTGAPPTYVKRGDEVRTISSSSLPVGIVDRVQFHTKKMTMVEGDFIVMVTDGIVDACKKEDRDDWIVETLKGTSNRNPQEIARIIFEKAVSEYEGNARDDMTVLVSKVWENI
jgi:stage II sporulation protein E